MIGTFVNALAVILGSSIGLLCKGKISTQMTENITKALGLCVCVIGISGAMQGEIMLLVVSLGVGTLIGEMFDIDRALNRFGNWIQGLFHKSGKDVNVAQGLVTATLLFCVGAMSIVGSIESGLTNNHEIIFTKSILDGISSIVLASTLGFGVLLSSLVILVYQGGIVLCSGLLQEIMVEELILQISATGSILILGLGLNMALNQRIKVANQLPALIICIFYYYIYCIFK